MGWENHFPLLGRLILVEFTIIVIKASFPAPGISFSCVGVLHRTSHPSGSRHLGQGVEDIILNQLPRPLSVSRTQKISGSSPCPINNNNHRHHGFKPTLWWFTARANKPKSLGRDGYQSDLLVTPTPMLVYRLGQILTKKVCLDRNPLRL
jgi:hypothetical protein